MHVLGNVGGSRSTQQKLTHGHVTTCKCHTGRPLMTKKQTEECIARVNHHLSLEIHSFVALSLENSGLTANSEH